MEQRTWGIIGGAVLIIALLSTLLPNKKSVDDHYYAAESHFRHREYQDAIKRYEKAIKASKKPGVNTVHIDKDFPAFANYKIALCYEKLGDTKKDNRFYDKAVTQIRNTLGETDVYKHRMDLYYLWATLLNKTEKHREADAKFSYFIQQYPNSSNVEEALFHQGKINKGLKRFYASQVAFQRLVDDFPTSKYRSEAEYNITQLLVAKHESLNNTKNNTKVEDESTGNLTNDSVSPEELKSEDIYNTAAQLLEQRKHFEAYQLFSTLLTKYPESKYKSFAYEGIGDVYFESENYIKARQNYEEAMYSSTDNIRKQKMNEKYQQTFLIPDTIDDIPNPILQSDLFTKAILYRKEGKYAEAAQLYETLSNSDIPTDDIVYALYWGGFSYYNAANDDDVTSLNKAAGMFERLLKDYSERPTFIKVYYYLASTYDKLGNALNGDRTNYQLVISTVDKANNRSGKLVNYSNQIWLTRLQDLRKSTINKINPSPTSEPDTVESHKEDDIAKHYEQALSYLDVNQYNKAIVEFEKCLYLDPDFHKAYCNLGVIYIRKKNYTRAVNLLTDAVAIKDDFKEAYFNLGLAYRKLNRLEDAKEAAENALRIDPNYENARILIESLED